ncbi:hypothetical protein ACERNI_10675 [Camelimonas sp. ID_303_24]
MIKAAVRAQFLAMTAPGSTPAQRVAQITGASAGTISRWQGDAYGELPPLEVIFQLEYLSQKPIVSRALAQLSSHRLTPIADDEAERDCFVSDLVELTGTSSGVTAEMSAALADGVVTPAEAKRVLARMAPHQDALTRVTRKLSTVAND